MSTAIKERPILFSAPMVRALLDGSKTQTRRIVKPQPAGEVWPMVDIAINVDTGQKEHVGVWFIDKNDRHDDGTMCPYGVPGSHLWVKETWAVGALNDPDKPSLIYPPTAWVHYFADGEPNPASGTGKCRPSIFMPRWASRILLEIVSVRVERLQDCSEADALAEGVRRWYSGSDPNSFGINERGCGFGTPGNWHFRNSAVRGYQALWESINGAGSWDANPWVWVVEFRRMEP